MRFPSLQAGLAVQPQPWVICNARTYAGVENKASKTTKLLMQQGGLAQRSCVRQPLQHGLHAQEECTRLQLLLLS
jgi:hypothetical protein